MMLVIPELLVHFGLRKESFQEPALQCCVMDLWVCRNLIIININGNDKKNTNVIELADVV